VDLQGPKIRVGQMDARLVSINAGAQVPLVAQGLLDRLGAIPMKYSDLQSVFGAGDRVLLGDSQVELALESVAGPTVITTLSAFSSFAIFFLAFTAGAAAASSLYFLETTWSCPRHGTSLCSGRSRPRTPKIGLP
jgi:hypothetical protein